MNQSISDIFISIRETIQELQFDELIDRLLRKTRFFARKNPVIRYIRRLLSSSVEAFLLIMIVWGLVVGLLYLTFMMWQLYLETPMGQRFQELFPERAQTIIELTGLSYWFFAAELTLAAFVICLGSGAVGHFLHINRYLYWSRGFFGKFLIWGSVLTCSVTYYIYNEYGFSSWEVTLLIAAVPTCCMFMNCFEYCQKFLPECGDIIRQFILIFQKLKKEIL